MKLLIALLMLIFVLTQTKATELKTKIEQVTVFQTGAQVTRIGSVQIAPGDQVLKIKNISPFLKKESIQVKSNDDLKIISVNFQVIQEQLPIPVAEIQVLEKKLKETTVKAEEIETKLQVLYLENNMFENIKNIPQQRTENIIELAIKTRQMVHIPLNELKQEILKLERELKELKETQSLTTQELKAKRLPRTLEHNEIVIAISNKLDQKAQFEISYIVTQARWFPSYDLRVKNINEALMIDYKANISQQSGEDWQNVKIKLSTSDPSISGQKPILNPWQLRLNQGYQQPQNPTTNFQRYTGTIYFKVSGKITDEYGEPLPFATVQVVGSTVGVSTDLDGNYFLNMPQGATQIKVSYIGFKTSVVNVNSETMNIVLGQDAALLDAVVIMSNNNEVRNVDSKQSLSIQNIKAISGIANNDYLGKKDKKYQASQSVAPIVQKIQNVVDTEFNIENRINVPSDTKSYTVKIDEIKAPAEYQYYCAPKLDKDVFLTAMLTNWEKYNLLEGQANIFFENTYLGTSLMDVRFLQDTLNISLGRDKNILVERKKLKENSKKEIFGNENISYRDWEINIRNSKKAKINLMLEDQFPLSMDERIIVKKEFVNEAIVNDLTGIITWKVNVEPEKSKKLNYKYSVKYPKNTFVGLD